VAIFSIEVSSKNIKGKGQGTSKKLSWMVKLK